MLGIRVDVFIMPTPMEMENVYKCNIYIYIKNCVV